MKRIYTLTFMLIFTLSCIWGNVQQKGLITTFTKAGQCYTGFSKKDVTSTAPIASEDMYADNAVIPFKFDAINGYYYTDVFYAFCVSFTSTPINVSVESSPNINIIDDTGAITGSLDGVTYRMVYSEKEVPKGRENDPPFGAWTAPSTGKGYSFSVKEVKSKYSKPRVVMSQPVVIQIPASAKILQGNKYSIQFTVKVVSGA